MMIKKKKFKTAFIILFVGFVVISVVLKVLHRPSIKEISENLSLEVPKDAEVLFYHKISSITSEAIYVKIRIRKNDWNEFSKNDSFVNAHKGTIGNNAFSATDVRYNSWNPQDVSESLSGRFTVYDKNKRSIVYLFDTQNGLEVDCYFAIYQE